VLETDIEAILRAQEDWLRHAQERGNHPGQVINAVQTAINACRSVVSSVAPRDGRDEYVRHLLEALDRRHDQYRREEDDEDGYGSSTFHEVKRELNALAPDNGWGSSG
jgi:hypothetical protein